MAAAAPDILADVKAALVGPTGALVGATGLADVELLYGVPGRDLFREALWVGGTVPWDTEWVGYGAREGASSVSERFTLEFGISVSTPGDDQQEATERALELWAAVETVLAADPTLGETETLAELVFQELKEAANTEGRESRLVGGVRCNALLRYMQDPVTIVTPSVTVDGHNNPVDNWVVPPATEASDTGWLVETASTEVTVGRDTVLSDWLLLLRPASTISATKRVRAGGLTYDVVGRPKVVRSPREPHHVEARLVLVEN